MKNKRMPILVKMLIFIVVFAVLGYFFYIYKDILFGMWLNLFEMRVSKQQTHNKQVYYNTASKNGKIFIADDTYALCICKHIRKRFGGFRNG